MITGDRGLKYLAKIILLDCRTSFAVLDDYKELEDDEIVLALVEAKTDLPIDLLSGFSGVLFCPFTKEELLARIKIAVSKSAKDTADDKFKLGDFEIDFINYEVLVDGVKIDLTYKEYELLRHMASSPGRVFTRSQLLKTIWGYDYIEGVRTVDVHIRRLRSKLGTKYANLIETVRHVGYRFKSGNSGK